MSLLQLIQQSGNVVTRRVSASVFQWMLAVSNAVDTIITSGVQAQTRYVFKNGNDTTGDGSFDAPFLTIQAAITSITDASATKPYTVQVGAGIYTETFAISPWVCVEGEDAGAVFLNPVTANWISAGFSAAGAQESGLGHCTLLTNFTVNFATVASPGAGTFKLYDCFLGTSVAVAFTGNNALNLAHLKNFQGVGTVSPTLTMTQITSNIDGNLRSGTATFVSTDAFQCIHRLGNFSTTGIITVTWTGATSANSLVLSLNNCMSPLNAANWNITGAGAQVLSKATFQITGPDANTTFSFGNVPNAGSVCPQGADVIIVANPTADRTYTIERPGLTGGHLRIVNQSAFVITIAVAGGATLSAGMPTYVGPQQTWDAYANSTVNWLPRTMVQSGTVTLSNGVSALIPADISLQSSIVASLRDFNAGVLGAAVSAKLAGRVVGTRAGGGGFVLTSVTTAGVTVATDQGIYDWHVNN